MSQIITAKLLLLYSKFKSRGAGKKTVPSLVFTLICLPLLLGVTACSDQPTDGELEALRQEAIARNKELIAIHKNDQSLSNWQLLVEGQIGSQQARAFSWEELNKLATTSVKTQEPHQKSDDSPVITFRGVAVSKLLDQFKVGSEVKEVTFVTYDSYRVTVSIADLRKYPIIIALERNGEKISRTQGGPLYLVFPHQDYPQLKSKYPSRFWAFYLTNLVVGTEPTQLQVGGRVLDAEALAKLPSVTLEKNVRYGNGWPDGKVKLAGVLLRKVLDTTRLSLSPASAVIVQNKSSVNQDVPTPIPLEASEVEECGFLLATNWGNNLQPIPAKMGGPVTLAPSSDCQAHNDERHWVTFVEALEVVN
ncbi:MAG: molybdopterin-dependent oxidoreductase [Coleofasciculaceae cyanobacterium]